MIDNFNISRIANALEKIDAGRLAVALERIADKMEDIDIALSSIDDQLEKIGELNEKR